MVTFPPCFSTARAAPSRILSSVNRTGLAMVHKFLVKGGGLAGQVDAIKLGIAKALTVAHADLRPVLKKADLLKRDPREKERKKYGLRSARKREQFSKR